MSDWFNIDAQFHLSQIDNDVRGIVGELERDHYFTDEDIRIDESKKTVKVSYAGEMGGVGLGGVLELLQDLGQIAIKPVEVKVTSKWDGTSTYTVGPGITLDL